MERAPDTLTSECSEKYQASIRLRSDGLYFSGYMPASDAEGSLFAETFLFDKGTPAIDSVKNIIFDHPVFSYAYLSLQVVCVDGKYVLTPDDVFSEHEKERLFYFCHPDDGRTKILTHTLECVQSVLLFDVDREIYEFMARSLVNPRFVHPLAEKLTDWQRYSRIRYPRQMYVDIHERTVDIACFERGEIIFLNSFDYATDNEIIYYAVLVCKQTGFDQLNDCLHLCGDHIRSLSIMPVIRNYVEQVDYMDDTNIAQT